MAIEVPDERFYTYSSHNDVRLISPTLLTPERHNRRTIPDPGQAGHFRIPVLEYGQ